MLTCLLLFQRQANSPICHLEIGKRLWRLKYNRLRGFMYQQTLLGIMCTGAGVSAILFVAEILVLQVNESAA